MEGIAYTAEVLRVPLASGEECDSPAVMSAGAAEQRHFHPKSSLIAQIFTSSKTFAGDKVL